MERDFKQEFIELKQNEIPDLWNRIEAGLSEKKVTASASEKADFSFKNINWRRWGTLAAACLCVVIIIPAISLIIRNNDSPSFSGSQSDGNMSNSTAMDYTTADCETSEAPEMNVGDNGGASTADEGGTYSEDKGTTGMVSDRDYSDDGVQSDMEMIQGNNASAAPSEAESTSETAKTDEEVRVENCEAIKDLDLKNGQIIENVIVQIVEAEAAGEEVIYRAVVLEADADANLKKNMQLEIVCDSDTEYDSLNMAESETMKEREDYEVSLRFEQEKIIVTNVKKAD